MSDTIIRLPLDTPTNSIEAVELKITHQEAEDDQLLTTVDIEETVTMFSSLAALSGNDEEGLGEEEDEEDTDFMSMLPTAVRHRVEKLKNLNTQRDSITEEYLVERAALEQKYAKLFQPMYDMRLGIINGSQDKNIAQEAKRTEYNDHKYGSLQVVAQASTSNNEKEEGENHDTLVGVPEFWFCAIGNIETVAELITERDNACLLHLENISYEDFPDGKGFTLKFHFEENPFFLNRILTKRYEVPNLLLDDEPLLKNVVGCDIKWKPLMCLTEKEVTKKQRSKSGKRAGQIRTITKREKMDSFFHFFSPPQIPSIEMDEEEADAIEEAFDHDYDVAQSFRSHIIPKAVLWFTGEAMEEEIECIIDRKDVSSGCGVLGTFCGSPLRIPGTEIKEQE